MKGYFGARNVCGDGEVADQKQVGRKRKGKHDGAVGGLWSAGKDARQGQSAGAKLEKKERGVARERGRLRAASA